MVDKALKVGGWIAAAILALILFVQNYLTDNPYPTDAPVDSPAAESSVN